MPLTGNKGEWSEIYVFLRLLATGKLFAADADLNKISGTFYNRNCLTWLNRKNAENTRVLEVVRSGKMYVNRALFLHRSYTTIFTLYFIFSISSRSHSNSLFV